MGKSEFIEQAFAPDAKIKFVDNGELKEWTRDEFAKRFQQPAADEYRGVRRVERLDVTGTAASAVLTLNYPQVQFTDHMSLLKIGGQWKIVGKVFSADRRDAAQETIKETLRDWMLPFEPRRIVGNIYYVGSNLISSFLIVTPAGRILLDTGPVEMVHKNEFLHLVRSNQDMGKGLSFLLSLNTYRRWTNSITAWLTSWARSCWVQ